MNDEIRRVVEALESAGLNVEPVKGTATFNVTSNATGAVLERLISVAQLKQFAICMDYVAIRHYREIYRSFTYIRPVHGI